MNTSELEARLKRAAMLHWEQKNRATSDLLNEAAAALSTLRQRIEALEAENARLRRNIKGWVEWHRRCDADDDCTYLNDNAWCGADALASTGMGLLAHAAMQQKERDDG